MLSNQHAALPQVKPLKATTLWKEDQLTLYPKEPENQAVTRAFRQETFHKDALSIRTIMEKFR
jgi:hypothetical protein